MTAMKTKMTAMMTMTKMTTIMTVNLYIAGWRQNATTAALFLMHTCATLGHGAVSK